MSAHRAITLYVSQSQLDELRRHTEGAGLEYCGDEQAAQMAVGLGLAEEIALYRSLAETFEEPTPEPTEPMVVPSDWTGALDRRQAS